MTPYAHQKHEMRYFVLQYANAVESFETTSSQWPSFTKARFRPFIV